MMRYQRKPIKKMIFISWLLSGLAGLFLLFDSIGKLIKPDVVIQGTLDLGYPESVINGLGIVLLCSTLLYLFPKTSFIGAVLLTGYLGGAIASHVRIENPLFSHVLFPAYVALFIWIGLYLRNPTLRKLIIQNKDSLVE